MQYYWHKPHLIDADQILMAYFQHIMIPKHLYAHLVASVHFEYIYLLLPFPENIGFYFLICNGPLIASKSPSDKGAQLAAEEDAKKGDLSKMKPRWRLLVSPYLSIQIRPYNISINQIRLQLHLLVRR